MVSGGVLGWCFGVSWTLGVEWWLAGYEEDGKKDGGKRGCARHMRTLTKPTREKPLCILRDVAGPLFFPRARLVDKVDGLQMRKTIEKADQLLRTHGPVPMVPAVKVVRVAAALEGVIVLRVGAADHGRVVREGDLADPAEDGDDVCSVQPDVEDLARGVPRVDGPVVVVGQLEEDQVGGCVHVGVLAVARPREREDMFGTTAGRELHGLGCHVVDLGDSGGQPVS